MTPIVSVARVEFTAAARLKWIRLLTAAFVLISCAAAYSSGSANELSGADGFARTTMTLVPVVLVLVPLAALVLGVSGQGSEPGADAFLYAQPIGRTAILLGTWIGESAALAGAVVVGFGVGGVVVAFNAGAEGLPGFALFVAAAVLLGVIFLAIAAAVASAIEKRPMALGVGTFVWFVFVLLYDGAALSLAGWLTGARGARILFASVLANPVDIVRVAMLSIAGTPNVLGAAGDAWVRFLGGSTQAVCLAALALVIWTAAPLCLGAGLLRRRDL